MLVELQGPAWGHRMVPTPNLSLRYLHVGCAPFSSVSEGFACPCLEHLQSTHSCCRYRAKVLGS